MTAQTPPPPIDQAALWNGTAGHAWVDSQALLDDLFAPFERRLADAVASSGASRLLDIGCGTGATTLAAAGRLAGEARALGVDISAPMIDLARRRAEAEGAPVRFECADAQTHGFDAAAFDMVISRFGVMFFADSVRAFANIRRAVAPGGALHMIVWRSAAENPFMTTAERAAAPLVPAMPPRKPDAPGQFAFGDPERVRGLLRDAGWSSIAIDPLDIECRFPAAALTRYFTRLGPLGLILAQADPDDRDRIVAAVRTAFDPYVDGDDVRFVAACWTITARA